MLVRITNRENPDQTASSEEDLGLHCLSWPFWQATSVQNFITFTVTVNVQMVSIQSNFDDSNSSGGSVRV